MKVNVSTRPLTDVAGDVLVVERYAGQPRLTPEALRVDRALDGLLTQVLGEERFEGRLGETSFVHAAGRLAVKRVLVVGMGPRAECTAETVRRAASAAACDRQSAGRGVCSPCPHTGRPAWTTRRRCSPCGGSARSREYAGHLGQ